MHKYTPEHLEFLRINYIIMRITDLTAAFNAEFGLCETKGKIHSALGNHKITSTRTGKPGTLRLLTRDQAQFIKDNYARLKSLALAAELTERFNTKITLHQLRSFARNHSIKSGRSGHYETGHKPWNADTKGQKLTGPNSGTYKKGNVPPNRKPVGSERIDLKDGYTLIKVNEQDPYTGFPTRYKLKHIVIWEEHNGPVPEGMVIIFADQDKTNFGIDNLIPVSRAELLRVNRYNYAETPPELKPSVLALAKLEVKTFGHITSQKRNCL